MSTVENLRIRSESVCSSDLDDVDLCCLTDIDFNNISNNMMTQSTEDDHLNEDDDENEKMLVPRISLRQRRRSTLLRDTPLTINLNIKNKLNFNQNTVTHLPSLSSPPTMSPGVRKLWKRALKKAKSFDDPWEKFHIEDLPIEDVVRHRYNAIKKKWVVDECQVKVENQPFNHGAMRSCFRLKKLSSFSKKKDWCNALNYVAKRYMEDVERDVYFEDVKLQMDAKLWGEEYNRHNPPKKVDIFQMCILEFKNRDDRPLYHLEHYIEGDYIKYNSNSGFVEEHLRNTPQAFSHFTFERSGHKLIVVDIQGVGDLWTDPQVHTEKGDAYGDGNLGTRGMALFFHSHICNTICKSLGLSKFDLSPSELSLQELFIKASQTPEACVTLAKGKEAMCISASEDESSDLVSFLNRSRTTSTCSQISELSETSNASDEMEHQRHSSIDDVEMLSPDSPHAPDSPPMMPKRKSRVRFISECESEESTMSNSTPPSITLNGEEESYAFHELTKKAPRPSCIHAEINLLGLGNMVIGDSVLGQIHHDLAKYHELGRFSMDDNDIDLDAAFFHEKLAADLGVMEAIRTMANLHLGIQREVLINYDVEDNEANRSKGIDYMYKAAVAGCRAAMIHMAKAFETGIGLGNERSIDWEESCSWYQKAIDTQDEDDSGEYDGMLETPIHQMQAKVAEMYLTGGPMLEKDPNYAGEMYTAAADSAMAAMKGRMANKYYALAEEAWGQVEE